MTTATSTKTSSYFLTIPATTFLCGTIEGPAGLTEAEVLKLITWEATRTFENNFKDLRSNALLTVEEAIPGDIGIEEEPNN